MGARRFKDRLLPEIPLGYREYPGLKPYGAVPAHPFLDDEIKKQQREINFGFHNLYKTPPEEMPDAFVDMIYDDYIINEERRKMINYEKFMKWSRCIDPQTDDLRMKLDLFERGQASPSDILDLAAITPPLTPGRTETDTDISMEFGKVTHPYGYRMEYVDPFRQEVNEAIERHGGVVIPDVEPYRALKILPYAYTYFDESGDKKQRLKGFIVKYKRDYGIVHLPGGTESMKLVERQIAAFRVDAASGFDQSIIENMNAVADAYPGRVRWEDHQNPNLQKRLARTGCEEFITAAVQGDSLEPFVVPISTTIYGYKIERSAPRKMGRRVINLGGRMAYFGKPDAEEA